MLRPGTLRNSQVIHRKTRYSMMLSLMTKKLCSLSWQICQTKIWSKKRNRTKAIAFDLAYVLRFVIFGQYIYVPLLCTIYKFLPHWSYHTPETQIPRTLQALLKGYSCRIVPARMNGVLPWAWTVNYSPLCVRPYFNGSRLPGLQAWAAPSCLRGLCNSSSLSVS